MKITELPDGVIAVKWNNARCKPDDTCLECSILGNKVFPIYSVGFNKLKPPPAHRDCKCYLTFIYSNYKLKEKNNE